MIENYKHYIEGTYANLSYDERMYYVNLLIKGDKHSTTDYGGWIGNPMTDDNAYTIKSELFDFFSDALKHIYQTYTPIFKELYIEEEIVEDFPNKSDILDSVGYIQEVKYQGFNNSLSIEIYYVLSNRNDNYYIKFDFKPIELFNDEFLDKKIKEKLQNHKRKLEFEIKYHQHKVEYFNNQLTKVEKYL